MCKSIQSNRHEEKSIYRRKCVMKSAIKETEGMCTITKKREEAEVKARVETIVSGYVMLK
jgi:hypothetical protein